MFRRLVRDPIALLLVALGLVGATVLAIMTAPAGLAAVVAAVGLPLSIVCFIIACIHMVRDKAARAVAQTRRAADAFAEARRARGGSGEDS